MKLDRDVIKNNGQRIEKVETHVDENMLKIQQLSYKIIDMEAKNRQTNIIIYGYEEKTDYGYDTIDLVREFMYNYLDLDPDEMCIEKAYRLGKIPRDYNSRYQGKLKRPLLVSFKYTSEVDVVMRSARNLRNTKYSIDRDYPPEIVAARKKLWPELKKLRKIPYNNVKMLFPAALMINNVVKYDEFPNWDSIIRAGVAYKPNYISPNRDHRSQPCNPQSQFSDPKTKFKIRHL